MPSDTAAEWILILMLFHNLLEESPTAFFNTLTDTFTAKWEPAQEQGETCEYNNCLRFCFLLFYPAPGFLEGMRRLGRSPLKKQPQSNKAKEKDHVAMIVRV